MGNEITEGGKESLCPPPRPPFDEIQNPDEDDGREVKGHNGGEKRPAGSVRAENGLCVPRAH